MKKDDTITVRLTTEEKQAMQQKAGEVPLSVIIRILLRKWLKGEIDFVD